MLSGIEVDTRELQILADRFDSLGGHFRDNDNLKHAFRQAGHYLVNKGKSNLRKRVKDQSNWQILNWFAVTVGRHGNYSLAGFKVPQASWHGTHHATPWWLNEGTKDRHTKSGHHTGAAKPNFFWDDVKKYDWQGAVDIVLDALRTEINQMQNKI